jgi:hypothetical protein
MSNILEYAGKIDVTTLGPTGVAPLDGVVTFIAPMLLPQRKVPKMRVCSVTISDRIPNVYDARPYYDFNNTLLQVYTNNPGSLTTIQLERGLYLEASDIADAINATINSLIGGSWWTNPLDPGITIAANPVINRIIITLDSTKLKAPHTGVFLDLRKATTGTDLATTLGFSQAIALIGAGVLPLNPIESVASDQNVLVDAQGTECIIQSSLIAARRKNADFSRTLAIIPFAGKRTASDNVWPSGGLVSPEMVYEGTRTISAFDIQVKTDEGRPMLFMSGKLNVVVAFEY